MNIKNTHWPSKHRSVFDMDNLEGMFYSNPSDCKIMTRRNRLYHKFFFEIIILKRVTDQVPFTFLCKAHNDKISNVLLF